MLHYDFGDVLKHTGADAAKVQRWCDAEIVQTAGGGSQGRRREFSFKNLIEIRVCDDLRGLGINEAGMRGVVRNLNSHWDVPDQLVDWRDPDGPTVRDAPILWVAFQRMTDPDIEVLAVYPVTPENLVSRLTDGAVDGSGIAEPGIALPIGRIIADLEHSTGDVFDLKAFARRVAAEAIAKAGKQ